MICCICNRARFECHRRQSSKLCRPSPFLWNFIYLKLNIPKEALIFVSIRSNISGYAKKTIPCCLNPNKMTDLLKCAEPIKYVDYQIVFNGLGGSTEKISLLNGLGYGSSPCLQTSINVLVGQQSYYMLHKIYHCISCRTYLKPETD